MDTVQKESKYIPEGAKCRPLNSLHYPQTGSNYKLENRFCQIY